MDNESDYVCIMRRLRDIADAINMKYYPGYATRSTQFQMVLKSPEYEKAPSTTKNEVVDLFERFMNLYDRTIPITPSVRMQHLHELVPETVDKKKLVGSFSTCCILSNSKVVKFSSSKPKLEQLLPDGIELDMVEVPHIITRYLITDDNLVKTGYLVESKFLGVSVLNMSLNAFYQRHSAIFESFQAYEKDGSLSVECIDCVHHIHKLGLVFTDIGPANVVYSRARQKCAFIDVEGEIPGDALEVNLITTEWNRSPQLAVGHSCSACRVPDFKEHKSEVLRHGDWYALFNFFLQANNLCRNKQKPRFYDAVHYGEGTKTEWYKHMVLQYHRNTEKWTRYAEKMAISTCKKCEIPLHIARRVYLYRPPCACAK